MIDTVVGMEKIVIPKLKEFSSVKEINIVYGEHDIICRIETDNMILLKRYLLENIRKIDGIISTVTLIAIWLFLTQFARIITGS